MTRFEQFCTMIDPACSMEPELIAMLHGYTMDAVECLPAGSAKNTKFGPMLNIIKRGV